MIDNQIICEARSWIGTRWVHGQAVKGQGTDCVGFIIQIGKHFSWIADDYVPPIYSRQHALHRDTSLLLVELDKFADRLPPLDCHAAAWHIGDILTFRYEGTAGHAGIYTGEGQFVHAFMPRKKVIESPVQDFIKDLHSVWRPKARRENADRE